MAIFTYLVVSLSNVSPMVKCFVMNNVHSLDLADKGGVGSG